MTDRTCKLCQKRFEYPRDLKAHEARKRPCSIQSPTVMNPLAVFACEDCGAVLSSKPSLSRHKKKNCKKRAAMVTVPESTFSRMKALIESSLQSTALPSGASIGNVNIGMPGSTNFNMSQLIQVANHNTINININPWDGDRPLPVSVQDLIQLCAENGRLTTYVNTRPGLACADPHLSRNVPELLASLVTAVFKDLEKRNVFFHKDFPLEAFVYSMREQWTAMQKEKAVEKLAVSATEELEQIFTRQEVPPKIHNVKFLIDEYRKHPGRHNEAYREYLEEDQSKEDLGYLLRAH